MFLKEKLNKKLNKFEVIKEKIPLTSTRCPGSLGGYSDCQVSPDACSGSIPLPRHLVLFQQGQLPVGTVYMECSTLDSSRLQTISCPQLILATHNPSFHAFRQISKLQEGVLGILLVQRGQHISRQTDVCSTCTVGSMFYVLVFSHVLRCYPRTHLIHATAPGNVCPPVAYSVTLSLAGAIHIVYLSGCLVAKCK